jgi:hypothetical protein
VGVRSEQRRYGVVDASAQSEIASMNNMKYIIFDNGSNDIPFIFPNFIDHLSVAQMHSE